MTVDPTTVRLAEISTFYSGGTPSKSKPEYWNGNIPWLTPKDMGRWGGATDAHVTREAVGNGTRMAPANAIFLTVRGMSLHNEIRLLKAERPMTFNQDIKAIVPNSGTDRSYLYYALVAKTADLLRSVEAAGHGTGTLPTQHLQNLPIPRFGATAEQSLGELFSALDDKIELNRRMNETLERQARALFRDWFVDFGPTRAKQSCAPSYLAPDLWNLFPATLDAEGKPEGWEYAPLKELLVLQRGFDLPKGQRTEGAFPVIAASGPSGTHHEMRVRGPGVCTGRSGVLGGVYYVAEDFWPLNTSLWIKEYPNSTPLHAFHILQEIDIGAFNAGSAVPTLNRNHIHELAQVKPPMSVVVAFDDLAGQLYKLREANLQESRILAQTRDLLLPKLMSGEIRVRDAEKFVELVP
jgi:Restriction endonuclease S subunits